MRKKHNKKLSRRASWSAHLHELEGELKVLHRVHFDAEELEAHDEADGGLDDVGALLLLPQLLQLGDELLPHCREPAGGRACKRSCVQFI